MTQKGTGPDPVGDGATTSPGRQGEAPRGGSEPSSRPPEEAEVVMSSDDQEIHDLVEKMIANRRRRMKR